jgi:hypothetical protein
VRDDFEKNLGGEGYENVVDGGLGGCVRSSRVLRDHFCRQYVVVFVESLLSLGCRVLFVVDGRCWKVEKLDGETEGSQLCCRE